MEYWSWVERLFHKISVPCALASAYISLFIFVFYIIFAWKVEYFKLDIYYYAGIIFISLVIPFQMAGIKYLMGSIRREIAGARQKSITQENKNIIDLCDGGPSIDDPLSRLEHNLRESPAYYGTIMLVIAPFVFNDVRQYMEGNIIFFYQVEPNIWSALLDIYTYAATYMIHFLLGTMIWILINISGTLKELGKRGYWREMRIYIFTANKVGEIERLRGMILRTTIYYFAVIFLVIVAILGPNAMVLRDSPQSIISYEMIAYMVFLLVGAYFFISSTGSIRRILISNIRCEAEIIEDAYNCAQQKFLDALSREGFAYGAGEVQEISNISNSLDMLQKEMNRYLEIDTKGYDIGSYAAFISSFLIPAVTLLQMIIDFM